MLKAGDKAPDFELASDGGGSVRLADFKGRSLVVYFYPKDDTPGCTREAVAFSEAMGAMAAAGAAVVGISRDSVASHAKFRDKYALRIPLLSDPDRAVHEAFGAYGEKMMYGKKILGTIRSTFVIDGEGTITKVFPSVKVDGHADAVLAIVGGATSSSAAKREPAGAKASPKAKAKAPGKKA